MDGVFLKKVCVVVYCSDDQDRLTKQSRTLAYTSTTSSTLTDSARFNFSFSYFGLYIYFAFYVTLNLLLLNIH